MHNDGGLQAHAAASSQTCRRKVRGYLCSRSAVVVGHPALVPIRHVYPVIRRTTNQFAIRHNPASCSDIKSPVVHLSCLFLCHVQLCITNTRYTTFELHQEIIGIKSGRCKKNCQQAYHKLDLFCFAPRIATSHNDCSQNG